MGGFSSPFLDNGRIMVFESQPLNLGLAEKFDVLQQSCACRVFRIKAVRTAGGIA